MTSRADGRAVVRSQVMGTLMVCLALAGVAVPGIARAGSGKSVSLSPATDVSGGQFVKVTWHGFDQFGAVEFRQCTQHPADINTDCTKPYQDTGRSTGSGSGELYQPVTLGDVPNVDWLDTDPTSNTFRCDSDTPCSVGVFPSGGGLADGAFATVKLAITADSCPTPTTSRVLGGGDSGVSKAMARWEAAVCQAPSNLPVGFSGTDSYTGISNFVGQVSGSDFAATQVPPTGADKQKLSSDGRTVAYAPASASGLVLAYKIFARDPVNFQQGPQITDLKLTPDLIAEMFTGQIDNWNATPQINALNPKYEGLWPSIVRPEARADASASTLEFTSWLSATATKASLGSAWHGPTNTYKTDLLGTTQLWTGEDALASAIAQPSENDYYAYGYIGYVDSSTAAFYGLPTVSIKNGAGKFVSATPANVNAALAAAHTAAGFIEPNFKTKNPAAYPMPSVTYLMLPTSKEPIAAGTVLHDFARYAATDGQAAKVLPVGYTPLNDQLTRAALAAADKVPHSASGPPSSPPPSTGTPPPSSTEPSATIGPSASDSLVPPPGTSSCAGDASPSVSPTASSSPASPSATGSPSASVSPSATHTPRAARTSPSPTASPSRTSMPSRTSKTSPTPTGSRTPRPSDTPTPTASATPSESPSAGVSPSGSATPTDSATPSPSPSVSCAPASPAPFDAATFGGASPKATAAILGLAVMGLAAGPVLRVLSGPNGAEWLRRWQEKIAGLGWWKL